MTSSQRILLNTLASYGRTVVSMALGIFSSRWILQALGEVDFGLMGVVGVMIMFITFLNAVTSASCSRFFALSIGKGDAQETNRWFNTALSVHFILPMLLVMIGYPMGIWAVNNFFNIPADRLETALWVFRMSLISAFFVMCLTPFIGMFYAKQKIFETSIWWIGRACAMFFFSYWLVLYQGDAWLVYTAGMVAIIFVMNLGQAFRAGHLFPECRICFSKWFDYKQIRELFVYSGWQLFGSFGAFANGKGIAILLNKFFNPTSFPSINASYAIAETVGGQAQTLSTSFINAFTPEITSSVGKGEDEKMLIHVIRCSKLGSLLVVLLVIPLFLDASFILQTWLKNPPEHAASFCKLILLQVVLNHLGFGYVVGINAKGNIRNHQLLTGGFFFFSMFLGGVLFYLGLPAISIMILNVITMFCYIWCQAFLGKRILNIPVLKWVCQVLFPVGIVCFCACLLGSIPVLYMPNASLHRFLCLGIFTVMGWGVSTWFIALTHDERKAFVSQFKQFRNKLKLY